MNELKRAIGKTIQQIIKNDDGENSFAIFKFKEGGKMNIAAHSSDKGIAQLELTLVDKKYEKQHLNNKFDMLIGKNIKSLEEDYDNSRNFIEMGFTDGCTLILTSYSSDQNSVGKIGVDIYENKNTTMKAKKINEYEEDGFDPKNEQYYSLKKELHDLVQKYVNEGTLTYDEIVDQMLEQLNQDLW